MSVASFPLRDQSVGVRLGLTCLALTMLAGLAASAAHLRDHHAPRDEQPGLSMDDVRGAYHGVRRPAPLVGALERDHPMDLDGVSPDTLSAADRRLLLAWLAGDRVSEDYDNLDLGDAAPAEIIAAACLDCHARQAEAGDGVGERVPLEYWDDVKKVAFAREINPTPVEILTTSTHTHALSLATLSFVVAGLLLATSWPRPLAHGLVLLTGVALLADITAWWVTREMAGVVWVVVVAGAAYNAGTALALVAVIVDLWMPRRA